VISYAKLNPLHHYWWNLIFPVACTRLIPGQS
jgi:hypothetical protein